MTKKMGTIMCKKCRERPALIVLHGGKMPICLCCAYYGGWEKYVPWVCLKKKYLDLNEIELKEPQWVIDRREKNNLKNNVRVNNNGKKI